MSDEYDDDDEISKIREARMKQLREEAKLKPQYLNEHGEYKEVDEQNFPRCKILDRKLEILAKTHMSTKFFKINVEKAAFFVAKLSIRVLPALIFFRNGIAVDRCIGFDEFGGDDNFKIEQLAMRIQKAGVLDFKHTKGLTIIQKSENKKYNKEED
ncbi:hypothetical protein DICPUDRAFT_80278 [Dictyostelium purpureum]|uniref:Thioredoxin domain-containing protein n=1 Tax=Dictyostelium purpureum TaxID=5786 RepID=F0ZQ12_DICPU|nr:uncharacterized protein DICPUDRAFT_80278 [Dictyostelium purpureum]EGC33980.1 hypothetical protein DICPUDRAFT_80278 [Dictyostelium purpureum]|eukprot:XP_003289513.1 hypothetical protein DICPUDRAFT_80278 [Dictyostelium purpureum]